MKPDTERTIRYQSSLHKKKDFLHVHVSKELAKRLTKKKRALLVRKGDEVRVMRGSAKGKTGKVVRVSHNRGKVFIDGVTKRTAKGREVPAALEPSNLMLVGLESTPERSEFYKEAPKARPAAEKTKEKQHEHTATPHAPVHAPAAETGKKQETD